MEKLTNSKSLLSLKKGDTIFVSGARVNGIFHVKNIDSNIMHYCKSSDYLCQRRYSWGCNCCFTAETDGTHCYNIYLISEEEAVQYELGMLCLT